VPDARRQAEPFASRVDYAGGQRGLAERPESCHTISCSAAGESAISVPGESYRGASHRNHFGKRVGASQVDAWYLRRVTPDVSMAGPPSKRVENGRRRQQTRTCVCVGTDRRQIAVLRTKDETEGRLWSVEMGWMAGRGKATMAIDTEPLHALSPPSTCTRALAEQPLHLSVYSHGTTAASIVSE
jgi:hypothetical protein